ncbi:hypothetical protein C6341_g24740 [Phytophthora cactorum]|nr:hypothetical protein C6341_g24740 [Phytophthora cactorum]
MVLCQSSDFGSESSVHHDTGVCPRQEETLSLSSAQSPLASWPLTPFALDDAVPIPPEVKESCHPCSEMCHPPGWWRWSGSFRMDCPSFLS